MRAWINFAATGDPNGPETPPWEPFDSTRDTYLAIDSAPTMQSGWRTDQLDFIERFYRERSASTAA